MSTNSNQGPPDLDVVFRQLFSFLFKKRNRRNRDQRRVEQEQNSFKRLLEKQKKKRLEKNRQPGRRVAATKNDRQAPEPIQRQRSETRAATKPRVDTVSVDAVKSKTGKTTEQRVSAEQRSQLRPAEPIKAHKVLKQNVNANSTRKWLHDSRALRQAFVLKELLEPPVALRKRPPRRFS